MSERIFLFLVGAIILIALYFEIDIVIYALCLWLLFEGASNIRITTLSQKFLHKTVPPGLATFSSTPRFAFDAFRMWRITVAIMLGGSLLLLHEKNIEVVWFFPWFMGFAILGASVSGVCPVLLFIRWLGFK
ncbi:MAG TPA: hypothetical protein ENJ11_07160 [Gammaproteobacteria bacterium]|nr:hypothetical protein [Gammaproteobacteria bacterium]